MKYLLTITILTITSFSFSQAIIRQSINAYGGHAKVKESILIEQSVGQPHQTESVEGTQNVRPGFIQSRTFNVEIDDNNNLEGKVYPNPATETFKIELEEELENAKIQITNSMGKVIENKEFNKFYHENFDSSQWGKGTYFISIASKDGKVFKSRLIILK